MNIKSGYLAATALALLLGATNLHAQVANVVTVAATASVGANSTQVGTVVTTPAAGKYAITTKTLLISIAVAEKLANRYNGPVPFPAGAKLVGFQVYGQIPVFKVLDKANNVLCDASNIMGNGPSVYYHAAIGYGSFNTATGLANPSQGYYELATFSYNDTGIAGSSQIKFNLIGVMTHTRADGARNRTTGIFTEKQTNIMAAGGGDGVTGGFPFTVIGKASYSGSSLFF